MSRLGRSLDPDSNLGDHLRVWRPSKHGRRVGYHFRSVLAQKRSRQPKFLLKAHFNLWKLVTDGFSYLSVLDRHVLDSSDGSSISSLIIILMVCDSRHKSAYKKFDWTTTNLRKRAHR